MSIISLSPTPSLLFTLLFVMAIMVLCVKKRKLTLQAAFTATIIGLLVLQAAYIKGVMMLITFFVLGVLATAHKKTIKIKLHPDNLADKGRNSGQVLANGGVAGLAAILAIIAPEYKDIFLIMMASALSSALADTLSSELGMVYGRRFYNILTFKREANGLDGVVSLEGLLIGASGSAIIALIYAGFSRTALVVLIAGIIGNLTDSILGATLERKHFIGNNMVNFMNTLIAAFAGVLIYLVL